MGDYISLSEIKNLIERVDKLERELTELKANIKEQYTKDTNNFNRILTEHYEKIVDLQKTQTEERNRFARAKERFGESE